MDLTKVPRQAMFHLNCMYFIGIHNGIQSYHAGIEYALKYWITPEFQRWANIDKVLYLYNGGDSNTTQSNHYDPNETYIGSMQDAMITLQRLGIKYACFFEPGSNNTLTSISFLLPEQVWDKKTYPEVNSNDVIVGLYEEYYTNVEEYGPRIANEIEMHGKFVALTREFIRQYKFAN